LVTTAPKVDYFKPRGVPLRELAEVRLSVEGLEALRLVEIEGLEQEEAAVLMNISRQTFGRVLSAARQAVARAVVLGQALRIEGGDYELKQAPDWTPRGRQAPDQPQPSTGSGWPAAGNPQEEERNVSKIAVSSEGPTMDDLVDPRFGRAGGFVLVDPQSLEFSYLDNGISQTRAQGAGIQAAEVVAGAGVTAVLTGYVGPKAFQALQAAGIQVVQDLEGLTVRQAVERFQSGQLKPAQGPNREGRGA
jgi:predicted DNA-binding protein (UPF0251 family)/predicted Fe-Mo cluster-binding NifX family protein